MELKAAFRFGQLLEAIEASRIPGEPLKKRAAFEGAAFLKNAQFALRTAEGKTLLSWSVRRTPHPEHEQIGEVRYEAVLPLNYFTWAGGREMMDIKSSADEDIVVVSAFLSGLLPLGLEAALKEKGPKQTPRKGAKKRSRQERKRRVGTFPLPPAIQRAVEQLQYVLRELQYLGPLRAPPRRDYIAAGAAGLGEPDEFLPFVLRDRGDELVSHCKPGRLQAAQQTLNVALNTWLHFLRTGMVSRHR